MLHLSKDIALGLYLCLRLEVWFSDSYMYFFCLAGTDKTPALLVVSLFVGVCVRLWEFFHHSGYRKKKVFYCSASLFMVVIIFQLR